MRGKAFGFAGQFEVDLVDVAVSQRVVCFTETPLEQIAMMLEDEPGRSVHFEPYGFLVTKPVARKTGCQPVWYTDHTRGASVAIQYRDEGRDPGTRSSMASSTLASSVKSQSLWSRSSGELADVAS